VFQEFEKGKDIPHPLSKNQNQDSLRAKLLALATTKWPKENN
jgi:hypothetical protein